MQAAADEGQSGSLVCVYLSRPGLHIDAGRCRLPQRVTHEARHILMVADEVTHYHRSVSQAMDGTAGVDGYQVWDVGNLLPHLPAVGVGFSTHRHI